MKKKAILSLTLLFLCGIFPLGNVFADSDSNEPENSDQTEQEELPELNNSDEPVTSEPGMTYVIGSRDLQIRRAKTPNEPYIKITDEGGGWNCGDECAKKGDGYSYESGILTLNNFGLKEKLIIYYSGEHPLEVKLTGANIFDLEASSDCVKTPTSPSPTLICGTIEFSGSGTMNGNIRMTSDNNREELIDSGYSPDIKINGATINADEISNEYGSVILNGGETNVNGTISAQKVKVNDGQLNINSETAGIELNNFFDKSGDAGLTINGGNVSIIAKENVIREVYGNAIFGGTSQTKEIFDKNWGNLISLGAGIGIKETDITIQGYKMLNSRIAVSEDLGGETQTDPYTYYSSLSYGNFKTTKGGVSIRDAVKVLHIGKEFKNKISKNSKIGVMDTLKNVNRSTMFVYEPGEQELEIKEIKIDDKTLDPTKYQAEKTRHHTSITLIMPAKTLFEIGIGKHEAVVKFNDESKNTSYEFEILETLKDYEYLLTYIDNPILEGENGKIIADEKTSYKVKFDRNIQLFDGFTIDGEEVPKEYYEIKSGSTIIEIKSEFLSMLSVGEHEISAKFLAEDDPISTTLTIAKAENKKQEDKKVEDKKETTDSPNAGVLSKENSSAIASIVVAIICALSIVVLAIIKTKKTHRKINYHL